MIHFMRKPHADSAIAEHVGPAILVRRLQAKRLDVTHYRMGRTGTFRMGVGGYFRLCRRLAPFTYWTYGPEFPGVVLWGMSGVIFPIDNPAQA